MRDTRKRDEEGRKVRKATDGLRGFECGRALAFHVDRRNGWVVYRRDADGCQVGDAEYHYLKADALAALERLGNEQEE